MRNRYFIIIACLLFLMSSCSSNKNDSGDTSENSSSSTSTSYHGAMYDDDDEEEYSDDEDDDESGQIDDGTYTATVDYYNPDTGFSNTYTLDVDVEDGQVVCIHFNNGGWIDCCEDLDDSGCCTVYDDDGREFEINIDL